MPRQTTHQNHNPEKRAVGHCKIRKRVSSSSSSSSAPSKNYRVKRAILVGKRTGSTTPVPTWNLIMTSRSRSPIQKSLNFENGVISGNNLKGKEGFSARKLAATFWEINGLHSPGGGGVGGLREENFESRRENERGRKNSVCEKIDGYKVEGQRRRRSSAASQKLQITEYTAGGGVEVARHHQGEKTWSYKARLKDVNNSLMASKEVVKALIRILSQEEEQCDSSITLVSALRDELDRARVHVEHLIQEDGYSSKEVHRLMKQFAEEKACWKSKKKEKVREAVSSITREVEIERKLRRQCERLNNKLGVELGDTRDDLSRALKELEVEKRAKEILEQTCDELARGIGDERLEFENERKMLQLADVLREERVQMKLQEARYEYEEKNAALDRFKAELQFYSYTHLIKKTQVGSLRNEENEGGVDEDHSGDSELHSIELSMDNNNKSFKWSFVDQGGSTITRPSIDEVFKGRKSLSEKVQWENICLQRTISDGIEWDFSKQGIDDGFGKGVRSSPSSSPAISTGKSSCLREACTAILKDLAARKDGSLNSLDLTEITRKRDILEFNYA